MNKCSCKYLKVLFSIILTVRHFVSAPIAQGHFDRLHNQHFGIEGEPIAPPQIIQNVYSSECRIIGNKPPINCSVSFSGYWKVDCPEYPENTLTTVLELDTTVTSFECVSRYPIAINFAFGLEKPRIRFRKLIRERIVSDYFDSTTYLFKIKMVTENPQYEYHDHEVGRRETSAFSYVLSNFGQLDNQTMKIHIVKKGNTGETEVFFSIKRTTINIQESLISVPCFSYKRKVNIFHSEMKSNTTVLTKLNIITYDLVDGFRVNISDIWNTNGTLICIPEGMEKNHSECVQGVSCVEFKLIFPPSVQSFPHQDYIYIQTGKSNTSLTSPIPDESNNKVVCSSTQHKVSIVKRETLEVLSKDYEVRNPEHHFIAEVVNLSNIFLHNDQRLTLDCVESSNPTNKMYSWVVDDGKSLNHLTFDHRNDKFICKGIANEYLSFGLQLECDDIYECRSWEKSLLNENITEFSELQSHLMNETLCDPDEFGKNNYSNFCVAAQPLKKGIIRCTPRAHEIYFRGFDDQIYTTWDVPKEAIIKLESSNNESFVLFNDAITFHCEGHSFFHSQGIQWLVEFINESVQVIPKKLLRESELPTDRDKYNPLSIVNIWFRYRDIKSIICAVPLLTTNEWQNQTMSVQVLDGHCKYFAPKILEVESEKEIALNEKGQSLTCAGQGLPPPTVEWSLPSQSPLQVVSQGDSYKLLIFPEYNDTLKGEYKCTATNAIGTVTKSYTVSTKKESTSGLRVDLIVAAVVVILLSLALCFVFSRLRTSQKLIIRLTNEEIKEFFNGAAQFNMDNAFSLPYDKNYELTKNSFEIYGNSILGSGEFGTVYKGRIHQHNSDFAFKEARTSNSSETLKGLLSELKIMMYIGTHENILRLVGAYTKEIQTGVLYIATELCSLGSLHSHLKRLNQDISENLENERWETKDLLPKFLQWSAGIAHGMEYLSFKHIVHSDLAARNVLLTEKEEVKISDFGLSRRMYNYCNYVKTDKSNPLPWKWMSIECLREMNFSTQSDIWAFGITVWEIFSLGKSPYPGISWTLEFMDMLDQGWRNLKPKYATDKLYKIMLECWSKDPAERPEFHTLRYYFLEYEDDNVLTEEVSEEIYEDPNKFQ